MLAILLGHLGDHLEVAVSLLRVRVEDVGEEAYDANDWAIAVLGVDLLLVELEDVWLDVGLVC